MITQFLGHIVRGEPIQLVDGGKQKRAFTYIDDGIDALMKIIANPRGVASGKIYNIGNPRNNYSIAQLASMMKSMALKYPEYKDSARKVKLVETSADAYYGKGYQDVQNRVPSDRQHHARAQLAPAGRACATRCTTSSRPTAAMSRRRAA